MADPGTPSGVLPPWTPTTSQGNVVDTQRMRKGEDDDGNKTINEYAVISELGRGAYGKVKLVTHIPTDSFYAIKIMNKHVLQKVRKGTSGKTAMDDVLREIAIMKALNHPNVVQLHEVINDPECRKLYLIIDFVENGPIWTQDDGPMPVETIRKHLVGMCQGLDYLHTQNILHRDIKPDNLLLDGEDVVKWCDFGVSGARDADGDGEDDDILDTEGTPAFLSPEQCQQQKIPGRMVDMWALGVTLYCLTFGRLPFTGSTIQEVFETISGAGPKFDNCPDEALEDLLRGLLARDLDARIGRKDGVREILRHRFIAGSAGAAVVEHKKIEVSSLNWFAAVKKGNNITLNVAGTVGVGLKVKKFKDTLRRASKRPDGESPRLSAQGSHQGSVQGSMLGSMQDVASRQQRAEPNSHPGEPAAASAAPPGTAPAAGAAGAGASLGAQTAAGVQESPRGGPQWQSCVRYIEEKGVARMIDAAVRELVAERPSNVPAWLAAYFDRQHEPPP
eukprot:TRINITY_DN12817_c0_g1_i1.p1 TRINITY_DN12817_c0_g1~~TRINITY_DN12817_c0_g1_i1.p1  ORF type:complete len:547 (+),score=181.69 TRINITY_DN12817_c0_g1_i1:132-1643(+)